MHTRPNSLCTPPPRNETNRGPDPLAVWGRSMYSALEWTLDYFRRDPSGPPLRTSPGTQGLPLSPPLPKSLAKNQNKRESLGRGEASEPRLLYFIAFAFEFLPGASNALPDRPLLLPLFFFFPHKPFHFVHSTRHASSSSCSRSLRVRRAALRRLLLIIEPGKLVGGGF